MGITKVKSSNGTTSDRNFQVLPELTSINRKIVPIALNVPVTIFKIPAVIGFQVYCAVVSVRYPFITVV